MSAIMFEEVTAVREPNPYLYLLLGSYLDPVGGMDQMTAYACRAAMAFIHRNLDFGAVSANGEMSESLDLYGRWMEDGADIRPAVWVAHADLPAIESVTDRISEFKVRGGVTIDPTYPYIVPGYLAQRIHADVHAEPPVPLGDGRMLCLRREATAGYLLGRSADVWLALHAHGIEPGFKLGGEMNNDIVLAVLLRSDLPSLNPGKAVAHAAHAANQAVHELLELQRPGLFLEASPDVAAWARATPSGFGTTIALDSKFVSLPRLARAMEGVNARTGVVGDERFAWKVDAEIGPLLDQSLHTRAPAPEDRQWTCYRSAAVCAWAFGEKADLAPVLGQFNLHP